MQALTETTIEAFAAAVRAELSDLPKREIEELTDGLEADLAERLSEEGENFNPGSAAVYAAELREAAGVTPKPEKKKFFSSRILLTNVESWFRRNNFGTAFFEFALSLRPVWWVLRAIVAYLIVYALGLAITVWLLPIFIVVSVQWGRKKWLRGKFFTALLLPLNLLAVALLYPAAAVIESKVVDYYSMQATLAMQRPIDGLRLNGEEVTKIKAFSNDMEVFDLQFTDQNGNPLPGWVANNGNPIEIPNVIGMTISELNTVIADAGIGGVDLNRIDDAPDNELVVISVDPPVGHWIDPNSSITATVGKPTN
ncbi:MAG: PASTA domain-containing protein [Rhodoluna sp.]